MIGGSGMLEVMAPISSIAPETPNPPETCVTCKKAPHQACSGCKNAPGYSRRVEDTCYCSAACQKVDRANHKELCNDLRAHRSLRRAGGNAPGELLCLQKEAIQFEYHSR